MVCEVYLNKTIKKKESVTWLNFSLSFLPSLNSVIFLRSENILYSKVKNLGNLQLCSMPWVGLNISIKQSLVHSAS